MELGSEVRELRPPRKSSVPPPQGTAQVSDAENSLVAGPKSGVLGSIFPHLVTFNSHTKLQCGPCVPAESSAYVRMTVVLQTSDNLWGCFFCHGPRILWSEPGML